MQPDGGSYITSRDWRRDGTQVVEIAAPLAARNRGAAGQVFVAVGRPPVVRGFELRTLKKLYPAEIGLLQVGALDSGLEKIGALEACARELGAAEIGAAKIGAPKVGAGKIGSRKVQAANAAGHGLILPGPVESERFQALEIVPGALTGVAGLLARAEDEDTAPGRSLRSGSAA